MPFDVLCLTASATLYTMFAERTKSLAKIREAFVSGVLTPLRARHHWGSNLREIFALGGFEPFRGVAK
jgi:hypothetical protein